MPLAKNPHAPGYIFTRTKEEAEVIDENYKLRQQRINDLRRLNIDINQDGVIDGKDVDLLDKAKKEL